MCANICMCVHVCIVVCTYFLSFLQITQNHRNQSYFVIRYFAEEVDVGNDILVNSQQYPLMMNKNYSIQV